MFFFFGLAALSLGPATFYVDKCPDMSLFLYTGAFLNTASFRGNIQGTFREHSGNIQETFRGYSGNIQGIFREHLGNIQGTFREHSGNIHERWEPLWSKQILSIE
jgi:hypothetical protein